MENNTENKQRFVAQYFGQQIVQDCYYNEGELTVVYSETLEEIQDVSWLELTPLSQITDEDAIELSSIIFGRKNIRAGKDLIEDIKWNNSFKEIIDSSNGHFGFECVFKAIDFLRSKSYALPFNGLSVETQIEYGWVRLKQVNNGK